MLRCRLLLSIAASFTVEGPCVCAPTTPVVHRSQGLINEEWIPHSPKMISSLSTSGPLSSTPTLLSRPRSYGFSAPKLTRVPGKFKCSYCKATWASHQVLVTEQTRKCYQGETCANCGTTVKPFWTGEFQGTVFDKIRHFDKSDHSYKPKRYKMRQGK